jgi:hypothetical protein
MPLDPSFRSRLREALQQSAVGRPARNPAEAGSREAATVAEAGSHGREERAEVESRVTELQYETEEERRHRVDAEQAAWIADGLGGWWNRDAAGVCLVVDRVYAADRIHGDAEIGRYAETLSRYQRSLRGFDVSAPAADSHTLFSDLDASDAGSLSERRGDPVGRPYGTDDGAAGRASDTSTSDVGPRTSDDDDRLLFFDLETTGLSGGAGTCVFLIGYGWFEGDCFRTRQYFLSGYAHEAALLRMAAEPLGVSDVAQDFSPAIARSGVAQDFSPARRVTLATFNGKTFDVPLIGGRYLFHRLPSPFDGVPHLDLLHPARRLWRHRPSSDRSVDRDRDDAFARYFRMTGSAAAEPASRLRRTGYDLSASAASCALGALEEAVLGFRRTGDVPGGEIPARYFHYARTGDVRPLASVFEHNRLDLVSLAALASFVARMLEEGPPATRNAHECLALGRLYERAGAVKRATACYERAVDGNDAAAWRRDEIVEREALRRLAMRHRRERRHEEAAAAWQRLLDLSSSRATVDVEALHALAVHHEHRSKDLQAARALVMRALDGTRDPRASHALRCRLARIEQKLAR